MQSFLGIGSEHWKHSCYATVLDVLFDYRPEAIFAEWSLREIAALKMQSSSYVVKRIENNIADVKIIDGDAPHFLLEGLNVSSCCPWETQAAITYAARNNIPIYFVDEPFSKQERFNTRTQNYGVIGFCSSKKYSQLLYTTTPTKQIGTGLRIRERNLFMVDAAHTIAKAHNAMRVAGVGGAHHYFVEEKNTLLSDIFLGTERQQWIIPRLIDATEKYVCDASSRKISVFR